MMERETAEQEMIDKWVQESRMLREQTDKPLPPFAYVLIKNDKFFAANVSKKEMRALQRRVGGAIHEISANRITGLCDLRSPWEKAIDEAEHERKVENWGEDAYFEISQNERQKRSELEAWLEDMAPELDAWDPKQVPDPWMLLEVCEQLELAGCSAVDVDALPSWDVVFYRDNPHEAGKLFCEVMRAGERMKREANQKPESPLPF